MFLYKDDEKSIDRVLGNLSVQRIFFTLASWEKLAVTDIITKTELSESIIHQSLKKMAEINLVEKVSRGIYSLNITPSTEYLKKFYSQLLIEYVGGELSQISNNLDTLPIEESSAQLDQLLFKWQPVVEEHYSFRVASLVETIINRTVYEGKQGDVTHE